MEYSWLKRLRIHWGGIEGPPAEPGAKTTVEHYGWGKECADDDWQVGGVRGE
jgi:hypothetical protein